MAEGEGWLSRNRKRDRRSYDDEWSTYEARGSGRSGRQSGGLVGGGTVATGSSSAASRRGGQHHGQVVDRNNITAQGDRVGMPHNPYPRQVTASSVASSNNYGSNASSRGGAAGGGGNASAGSRIRVADYRGAAARVGALPAKDGPPPSIYQTDPSFRGGGGGGARSGGNNGIALFQNAEFLNSLKNPPPITVNLPPDLRSTLNNEQCRVVESVLSGHSTFFTGPAGSGKSHVLSSLLKANAEGCTLSGQPKKIVITATTGVAACNVGGITIHSFSGVGAGKGTTADLAKRVMGNEYTKTRWREVDILVVDEISMMAGSFLDKISFVASRARSDRRPFGGVQLVVCGDFFQLPPVELSKDGFAFEAKCWSEVIKCSVLLKQVFRQQGDTTLMNILDEARIGELSAKSAEALRRHGALPAAAFGSSRKPDDAEERVIPTLLECKNRMVDRANERELAILPGELVSFNSRDRAVTEAYKNQLKHCQAPPQLDLKIGAQVMLLKNIDLERGLANGSRGVVVRFQRPANASDVPTGFKKMELPVVKFGSVKAVGKDKEGGDNSTEEDNEFTIHPEEWTNKMGDQTVSSRVQIPLRLAWSISVHKSQGMTIPNLTVNLAGVFEYGQAYVALSRATELKLLTLRGFSEKSFRAHPKVKSFYSLLDNPNLGQINKENVVAQHSDGCIGDLHDPFEGDQAQHNSYNAGSMNPYSQRKQPVSSYSSNPYQQAKLQWQSNVQTTGRFSPVPPSAPRPPQSSTGSVSPTLTQDQLKRMQENRKRALAIRMKKQNDSSHQP